MTMLAFIEDFDREIEGQSDRGLAILGLAGIDYMLRNLLETALPGSSSKLYEPNAPFGSLSARISTTFAMGLITGKERRELDILRKIRNDFAHKLADASFASTSISDRCRSLELGETLYTPKVIPFATWTDGTKYIPHHPESVPDLPSVSLVLDDANNARVRFHASVRVLVRVLASRAAIAGMRPRSEVLRDFETPEQVDEPLIETLETRIAELDGLVARAQRVGDQMIEADSEQSAIDDVSQLLASIDDQLKRARVMRSILLYSAELFRRARKQS